MSSSKRIVTRVFSGGTLNTAPRLPLLKSYSFLILPHLRARESIPMVIHRSSFPRSSRTDIALASSSAVTASAKRTRCLRRFALALAGSHSTAILCTSVHRLQRTRRDLEPARAPPTRIDDYTTRHHEDPLNEFLPWFPF